LGLEKTGKRRDARCSPDPNHICASLRAAAGLLCGHCMGGKGCSFLGQVLAGPFVTPDGCCYDVTGDGVPNP